MSSEISATVRDAPQLGLPFVLLNATLETLIAHDSICKLGHFHKVSKVKYLKAICMLKNEGIKLVRAVESFVIMSVARVDMKIFEFMHE